MEGSLDGERAERVVEVAEPFDQRQGAVLDADVGPVAGVVDGDEPGADVVEQAGRPPAGGGAVDVPVDDAVQAGLGG